MNLKDNFVGILLVTMVALYLPVAGTVKSKIPDSIKTENIATAKAEAEASTDQNFPESKLPSLVGEFLGRIVKKDPKSEKWQLIGSEGSTLKIERQADQAKQNVYWADPSNLKNPRFMIATLADPIDSHTEWLFDQSMDAIQRALEFSGYQIDRYWLPWKRDSKLNEHREKPGILLFRKESSVLILYIVGETPTSGIHKLPFEIALSEIRKHGERLKDGTLRIDVLGPTFSGSVTSFRNAIESWLKPNERVYFNFVSGSATAIVKKEFEESLTKLGVSVEFHTTVRKDNELFVALLRAIKWQARPIMGNSTTLNRTGQIALLTESNTAYGQNISSILAGSIHELFQVIDVDKLDNFNCKRSIISLEKTLYGANYLTREELKKVIESRFLEVSSVCSGSLSEPVLNRISADVEAIWDIKHIVVLPFPLHISGVRSEYEKNRTLRIETADKTKNPAIGLDLSLNEEGEPQDVLPPMSPRITSTTADLVLANILSTINKADIRYVGLFATDTRDKLFLAEQLRRYCPNVQLLTTEADLLYSHRQYVKFTRGMIVASTYPLIYLNNEWNDGSEVERKRLQFPNSSSQGVFNAVLALLNDPEFPLMGYNTPIYSKKAFPPVWITAVGYRGPVPLWFSENANDDYLFKPEVSKKTISIGTKPPESQFLNILLFLLCIFALAHFMGFVYQNPQQKSSSQKSSTPQICRWWFDTLKMTDRENCFSTKQLFYLFFLFMFLLILSARLTAIAFLWEYERDSLLRVFAYVTLFFLLSTSIYLTYRILSCSKKRWTQLLFFVLCWTPLFGYEYYLFSNFVNMRTLPRLVFYARVGDPISGLSPLVPLLLLSAIVYLWLILQIKRIYLLRTSNINQEILAASKIANGEVKEIGNSINKILSNTVLTDPLVAPILVFIVGVVCIHLGHRFLPSLEGARFNLEFKVLLLASFIFILIAQSKFIVLSYNLLRLTRSLAAHPFAEAFSRIPSSLTKDLGKDFYIKRPTLQQLSLTQERTKKVLLNHPDVEKYEDLLLDDLHNYGTEQAWSNNRSYRKYSDLWMMVETATKNRKSKDSKWKESAEEFLVTRMVFFFRELFIHLRNYLAFATLGAMLILASISYYPFQPKRLLMVFLINLILVISGYAFFFFIQMNRDEILSRLFGTKINKVSWDKSFVIRMLVYVLFPILTMIAAQFPEIGSFLFSALDPIQRVLP